MQARRRLLAVAGVLVLAALAAGVAGAILGGSGRVRIVQVSPEGTADPEAPVAVRFSQAMVAPSEVGRAIPPSLLRLEPDPKASFIWADGETAQLRPGRRLAVSTRYTIVADASLCSLAGRPLGQNRRFVFQTTPLQVTGVRQVGIDTERQVRLALCFNQPVSARELRQHLVLTAADGQPIPYRCPDGAAGESLALLFDGTLPQDWVKVRLDRELRGEEGNLGLTQEFQTTLKLDRELRLGELEGESWLGGGRIRVYLNGEVDPQQAATFIRCEPPTPFSAARFWGGLELAGDFRCDTSYRLQFLKGLPARNGTELAADVNRTLRLPELSPTVRFGAPGLFMAGQGQRLLPLETVNVEGVEVVLGRVYPQNLVFFLSQRFLEARELGPELYRHRYPLAARRNQPSVLELDLKQLLPPDARGLFVATAEADRRSWRRHSRAVVVSDLAMTLKTGPGELWVALRRLSDATPVAGAKVRVFSSTNQVFLEGQTAADGTLVLPCPPAPEGSDLRPYVVVAEAAGDMTFLQVGSADLEASRAFARLPPYQGQRYAAFLFSDRGVYRPGDRAHLRALVRAPGPALPGKFPVTLRIARPDGLAFGQYSLALDDWGAAELELRLPDFALTGNYRASLFSPADKEPIGEVAFQVEDFLPNRLKVELTGLEAGRLAPGETLHFGVRANLLFGTPAAGHAVTALVELLPAEFSHPDFPGYSFTDRTRELAPLHSELPATTLDAAGQATFAWELPARLNPPSGLAVRVTATVAELGGRRVSAARSLPLDPWPRYLGLKAAARGAGPGQKASVDAVLVPPAGPPAGEAECRVQLWRLEPHATWSVDSSGEFRFDASTQRLPVATQTLFLRQGRGRFEFVPAGPGTYQLVCQDLAGSFASSLEFDVGDGRWQGRDPEKLELTLDRPAYRPGDTARLTVRGPFPGRVQVTLETDRVLWQQEVELPAAGTTVAVPVPAGAGPNAYCVASAYRGVTAAALPNRAFGALPLPLDLQDRRLKLELQAPAQVRPGETLPVAVRVLDADGKGVAATLTLAAVDEGILQLTGFATPDPWACFYASRALGNVTADTYALLMPEAESWRRHRELATGGDAEALARRLNPVRAERVRPVALWRGSLTTDAEGLAEAHFTVPRFTGRLRVMAVAATAASFGNGEASVVLRDPLIVQAQLPRFLAPGDEFELPVGVTLADNLRAEGKLAVQVQAGEDGECLDGNERTLAAVPGSTVQVRFRLRAPPRPGPVNVVVTARLGGLEAVERTSLPVRPIVPLSAQTGSGSIAVGSPTRLALPGGWLDKTDRYWVSFAATPMLNFGDNLRFLLRYPYGCVEQTTSRALPLLYLGDLAAFMAPGTFEAAQREEYVLEAVRRLQAMQTRSGGLGMWPGDDEPYRWGTIYATHFLIEARRAGYPVPPALLDGCLNFLSQNVLTRPDEALEAQAYALYVLALGGGPDPATLSRLYGRRQELPRESRLQLACALQAAGRAQEAEPLTLPNPLSEVAGPATRDLGGLLRSPLRQRAIVLDCLLTLRPDDAEVPKLARELSARLQDDRPETTQENAFALLALGKFARQQQLDSAYEAHVILDGQELKSFTANDNVLLRPEKAGGRTLQITSSGHGRLYYFWGAEGVPLAAEAPCYDRNLKVRRYFYDRQGHELPPDRLQVGQLLVVELRLETKEARQNLVLSDLLPACLEIENPRLSSSEHLPWLTGQAGPARHVEMRDDRYLVFADLPREGEYRYRYLARAVTRGCFALPPVQAACMYDPDYESFHGAGQCVVQ